MKRNEPRYFDLKASLPQLVVQLCVDQMDLAQIGRGRLMRVTFDTEPGHRPDTGLVGFDQSVP